MKTFDLYIIRKFLGTFMFMIIAFVIVAVVFDVSENIDDLLQSNAAAHEIIFDYYLNFCFYFGNLLSSFIVFLSVIWVTSKLAQQSEIIAMLAGGVSYRRIILPYFMAAAALVALSLTLSHLVVPGANRTKLDFELKYLKGDLNVADRNIHREVEPGTLVHFRTVSLEKQSGTQFSLEKWENGRLVMKINGGSAARDSINNLWTITNADVRYFYSDGSERVYHRERLDTALNLSISKFAERSEVVSTMSNAQLNQYLAQEKSGGSGRIAFIEIEKFSRTSNAFGIFVLTLIGVSVSSRKSRGGTGFHLFLALVIGLFFVFISRFATVAATNVGFPTSVAVWVPNMIFLLVGIALFWRAQK
ncbi:MAG: LptF/LptG family permease [Flavobacteriales bacterium]|nr:LptF/LptG family permease [Flavobacteriales bacterium]